MYVVIIRNESSMVMMGKYIICNKYSFLIKCDFFSIVRTMALIEAFKSDPKVLAEELREYAVVDESATNDAVKSGRSSSKQRAKSSSSVRGS
jgi:hypothetical protein